MRKYIWGKKNFKESACKNKRKLSLHLTLVEVCRNHMKYSKLYWRCDKIIDMYLRVW